MPAHNVNTAALEMVVEAARRFEQIAIGLNISTVLLSDDDCELSTAIMMMDKVVDVADRNGTTIFLENEREH